MASSPTRVTQLVLGSMGVTVTNIIALTAAIQGFGGGVSFPQIGAAYLGAAALATASPTPGGLGALEAALAAGLRLRHGRQHCGVGRAQLPAGDLLAARLPGWVCFHWMERRGEL